MVVVVLWLCGDARPHLTKRLPTTNVIRANGPLRLDGEVGRSSAIPVLHTMLEGLCLLDCNIVAGKVCDRKRRDFEGKQFAIGEQQAGKTSHAYACH